MVWIFSGDWRRTTGDSLYCSVEFIFSAFVRQSEGALRRQFDGLVTAPVETCKYLSACECVSATVVWFDGASCLVSCQCGGNLKDYPSCKELRRF